MIRSIPYISFLVYIFGIPSCSNSCVSSLIGIDVINPSKRIDIYTKVMKEINILNMDILNSIQIHRRLARALSEHG